MQRKALMGRLAEFIFFCCMGMQGCCNSKSQRETCRRDHSTVMQRSLNFRLRCLGLWTSLSTHFTTIKISSLENIFGMVVNIFVYGGHVLF
ncbi:hypothetical protein ACSBR2_034333 [Camellia fascicularis]